MQSFVFAEPVRHAHIFLKVTSFFALVYSISSNKDNNGTKEIKKNIYLNERTEIVNLNAIAL